jgi:dihydroneopterin aldolase/2-amino-4-hydroxy-6-hydroxymethyldihydropteridine diphosphokinase
MAQAFIGVGSNIEPEKNIREALRRLGEYVQLTGISTFYVEPAIDGPEEPTFYNGVVAIETDLKPLNLKHEILRRIEAAMGRRRNATKNAPRTIDLDLLLYDDSALSNNDLSLPHPDILKRAFVAIPLYELAPDLVLPGSGLPVRQIVERFDATEMEPLREFTRLLRNELLFGVRFP